MFSRHLKRAGALALVLVTLSVASLPAAAMPIGTGSGVESAADSQSLWDAVTGWLWSWLGADAEPPVSTTDSTTTNATEGGTTDGDGGDGGDAGGGLDPNG